MSGGERGRGCLGQEGLAEAEHALDVEVVAEVPLLVAAVEDGALVHKPATMTRRTCQWWSHPAQLNSTSMAPVCRLVTQSHRTACATLAANAATASPLSTSRCSVVMPGAA